MTAKRAAFFRVFAGQVNVKAKRGYGGNEGGSYD
ncbi:hypothetical protein COLO4_32256 [Corchorus olitorius]|uniref:Uncharacterized protein n=1 Tax=Corchorus olitorius TaxID=93759 RepID=A0A1R3H085_9ROSI|nr:hypothetical protein COLO4_32256 [Corchorus olitorius]